jgi:very-short-patch-repair endonuclease
VGLDSPSSLSLLPLIADFYCAKVKLIIEIDGDSHAEPDQAEYDAARTEWLKARGYRVIRFGNNDVHGNLYAVLKVILEARDKLKGD